MIQENMAKPSTHSAPESSTELKANPYAPIKYPKTIGVDFRKLEKATLERILKQYNLTLINDMPQAELAVLTAKVFQKHAPFENSIIENFIFKHCRSLAEPSGYNNKTKPNLTRLQLDSEPAKVGEQVAAKVSRSNENGSWILGSIIDFDMKTYFYEVQDEDDVNRVMHLQMQDVKRLEDQVSHLRRGDHVLAVFPETTSFYRGIVAKNPKPVHGSGSTDVIVRFEDDEDETGRAPPRRVPARFILKRSYVEPDFDENEYDDDN